MWVVYEHKQVAKQLDRLPKSVLKCYEKWKDVVQLSGVEGLKLILGFHDEALQGDWVGHRSSRLNLKYRIIYRVEADKFWVKVVRVSAHDYQKKR